jgi:hypothetical protein
MLMLKLLKCWRRYPKRSAYLLCNLQTKRTYIKLNPKCKITQHNNHFLENNNYQIELHTTLGCVLKRVCRVRLIGLLSYLTLLTGF